MFNLHTVQPQCPVGSSIAGTLTEIDERLTRSVEAELDAISLVDVLSRARSTPAIFLSAGSARG